MFDRITVEGPRFPSKIEVTEKRAPTDESVRMLRELEEAAEKRVLCRGELQSNLLHDIKWVVRQDFETDEIKGKVRFVLNGKEHILDVPCGCAAQMRYGVTPREFIQAVHQKVIEKLAEQITTSFIDKEAPLLLKKSH